MQSMPIVFTLQPGVETNETLKHGSFPEGGRIRGIAWTVPWHKLGLVVESFSTTLQPTSENLLGTRCCVYQIDDFRISDPWKSKIALASGVRRCYISTSFAKVKKGHPSQKYQSRTPSRERKHSMPVIRILLCFIILFWVGGAFAQGVPPLTPQTPPPSDDQTWLPETPCPGQFPSDLTIQNCSYSVNQRIEDWTTTSFTDQAILTSAGSALWGFGIRSPQEWPRTSLGYAERLRASYISGAANGSTQFLLNSLINADPRHVSCAEDPIYAEKRKAAIANHTPVPCSGKMQFFSRTGHALMDTVLVRQSTDDGRGKRWPSPRIVGGFAGAYAQSPWEPAGENTPTAILTRAGESMIVPLLGSLLHEYPSLLKAITKPFHTDKPLPKWSPGAAQ